jgi:molybdopterin-guanine dinucleotide biosynthesis protein A
MIADCTAVIMAGGDSRRMGQDKADMLLGERTLLQRVAATLHPLFTDVIISVRQPRSGIALPQVCDNPLYAGPLAGLAAGLECASTPWIFAVACDMPFITSAVIEYLARQRVHCQAVVPLAGGFPQPLAAFYSTDCLDVVRDILGSNGKCSMLDPLEKLLVRYVSEEKLLAIDPQLRSFFDLDTPQDVALALNQEDTK